MERPPALRAVGAVLLGFVVGAALAWPAVPSLSGGPPTDPSAYSSTAIAMFVGALAIAMFGTGTWALYQLFLLADR